VPSPKGGRKPSLDIVGQDSPGRRHPAFRQQAPSSRMISTMATRKAAIFAAHGAMMPSSAALVQAVLVM
jgi:hypothetical protein